MKILFLISSLNAGGAERVASTLCNAWASRGDKVTLVPTFSGGGESFYDLDCRVNLLYLASLVGGGVRNKRRYYERIVALYRLVRRESPDVIVSFLPNVNVAAVLVAAFCNVPCVISERSDPSMMPLSRFWRIACNVFYRHADMLTVQTEAVKESIHSVYRGLSSLAVVPNPLPVGLLDYQADLNTKKERRVLLSLGRLSEEKRVGQIIDAFSELAPSFPEWDLQIYGEGPEKELHAKKIRENALGSRVFLKGRTTEPELVMASSDAFVLNSKFEGFPNALLEAMGVGLPCVASDCPSGPREISRDGIDALLYPVDDFSALRSSLARVMGNSGFRCDLGRRARESVVSRYSLDAVLSVWDEIFRRVGAA